MWREGDRLVIAVARRPSLRSVLAGLVTLEEDFPSIEDAPPEPFEL